MVFLKISPNSKENCAGVSFFVFSSEFEVIVQSTFLIEHLRVTASLGNLGRPNFLMGITKL